MDYPKDKDYTQVIKSGFDEETQRHKVEAILTDGVDAVVVNPDGSINVNVISGGSGGGGGSTEPTKIAETGTVVTKYNEVTSVSGNVSTQIVAYTATQDTRVKLIEVTGTNIAEYSVRVNGVTVNKRRTHYSNLNSNFEFSKGLNIQVGDVVSVNVIHYKSTVGNFNAFILALKDSAATIPSQNTLTNEVVETGTVVSTYHQVTSVASEQDTLVASFTCVQPTRLKLVEVSGTNIAEYTVKVNGTIVNKKITFFGELDATFEFEKGLSLQLGDVIAVNTKHHRPTVGDFSAFILVLEDTVTQ